MKKINVHNSEPAFVDDDIAEIAESFKWHLNKDGYPVAVVEAQTPSGRSSLYLHQLVTNSKNRYDHVDRNKLNNLRSNLRLCSHSQNMANRRKFTGCSSRFKGVRLHKPSGKWIAAVQNKHIGLFQNEIDAAKAYDVVAKQNFGEFAKTNF